MPGCVTLGGVENGAGGANPFKLVGYREYLKTASNQSAINQVYMTKDMAILGPAYPPINVNFEATSFASSTRCQMVTSLCDAQASSGAEPYLDADIFFNCSVAVAGLNFTGNFSQLSGTTGTTAQKWISRPLSLTPMPLMATIMVWVSVTSVTRRRTTQASYLRR